MDASPTTRNTAMTRPVLAILGATGQQGRSLAHAALSDPRQAFAVRALTRHPDSSAARELADAGATPCAVDLDDAASLLRAFDGAQAVFAMTDFWSHGSAEREIAQAGRIAAAARSAGVAHVVWSTLEDTREHVPLDDPRMPTLQGRFKVPHLDAKAEATRLFAAAGVPTTCLYLSFYWDNLIHFGLGPQRGADGELEFTLPMGRAALPGIAAQDIGPCALALFKDGPPAAMRHVGIAGEHLDVAQMAHALGKALGEPVRPRTPEPADFARLPFPGAAELANMFQFKRDFEPVFRGRRDVQATRRLHPGVLGFDAWLARHAHRIAVPPRTPARA